MSELECVFSAAYAPPGTPQMCYFLQKQLLVYTSESSLPDPSQLLSTPVFPSEFPRKCPAFPVPEALGNQCEPPLQIAVWAIAEAVHQRKNLRRSSQ